MRRLLPTVILLVGFAALALNVLTLPRPFSEEPCTPPFASEGCVDTRLGLDLQGGLRGEYRAVGTAERPVTRDNLGDIRTIIENRINQYGVAEPIVQTQGTDRIVVEIPGVTNVDDVRRLIGSTGLLEFVGVTPGAQGVQQGSGKPPGELLFTGAEVSAAAPGFDQQGRRAVDITLRDNGARIFDAYAAQHFNNQDQIA